MWQGLDNVVEELKKIASVDLLQHRSVISLIGNTQMATLILQKVRITDTLSNWNFGREKMKLILSCFLVAVHIALLFFEQIHIALLY